jgi:hypothetical protein
MKVQVQANYWHKIIDHYHNILNEKFLGQIYTPRTQHFMREVFEAEMQKAKARETHPAWHIPLQLRFDPLAHNFIIEATSSNELEFI